MKTTDFWGNLMLPMVKRERRIRQSRGITDSIERIHHNFPRAGKETQAERAKIPMGVSLAVKEGLEVALASFDDKGMTQT